MASGNWLVYVLLIGLAKFVIVTDGLTSATKAQYLAYDRCTRQSQCKPPNSFCSITSPSCGGGTCVCVPGFETDEYRIWCKKSVKTGESCIPRYTNCNDPNAKCVNNTCQCNAGYKTAPYQAECIPETKVSASGEKCTSTDQCYNEMTCDNSTLTCGCPKGYRQKDQYRCIANKLGDACLEEADCSQVASATCTLAKCACKRGARKTAITVITSAENANEPTFGIDYTCYEGTNDAGNENENCNVYSQLGAIKQCRYPFECRFCSYRFLCTRPNIIFKGNAVGLQSNAAVVSIIFSLFLLMNVLQYSH